MTDVISDATVGDLLGFQKVGDTWKDKEGQDLTRVLELLAETKLSDMNDTIDNWYLGDLMGFEKTGDGWHDPDGNADSVVLRFADLKISELSDSETINETVNSLNMYEIFGYTQKPDGWYDGDQRVTGVMAYLAPFAVHEISNKVEDMQLKDALGYEKVDGVWIDEDGNEASPILAVLADAKISEVGVRADSLTLADALGYEKVGGVWKDKNGQDASAFISALADAKLGEVGSRMNNLKVSDIFSNTSDGFFKIIGGETKLLELDTRIDTLFGKGTDAATIGDFMDAGIVSDVSPEADAKLKARIGTGWRDYAISSFIDNIIKVVVEAPEI